MLVLSNNIMIPFIFWLLPHLSPLILCGSQKSRRRFNSLLSSLSQEGTAPLTTSFKKPLLLVKPKLVRAGSTALIMFYGFQSVESHVVGFTLFIVQNASFHDMMEEVVWDPPFKGKGHILWQTGFLIVMWFIWLRRNMRMFFCLQIVRGDILDFLWTLNSNWIWNYPLFFISRSWKSFL